MIIHDPISGKQYTPSVWTSAEYLVELRKTQPMWDVIAKIIDIWASQNPQRWQSLLLSWDETRKTRANVYGATKSKSLRYTLDIPEDIHNMIRVLYPVEDLPMDKKFFRTFGKKFPKFLICEKL